MRRSRRSRSADPRVHDAPKPAVYGAALRFLYDVTLDRPAVTARIPRRRVPERQPSSTRRQNAVRR